VGQNDVFLIYDALKYNISDVPLTLGSETHDHNKNECRFEENIENFPRETSKSRKHPRIAWVLKWVS